MRLNCLPLLPYLCQCWANNQFLLLSFSSAQCLDEPHAILWVYHPLQHLEIQLFSDSPKSPFKIDNWFNDGQNSSSFSSISFFRRQSVWNIFIHFWYSVSSSAISRCLTRFMSSHSSDSSDLLTLIINRIGNKFFFWHLHLTHSIFFRWAWYRWSRQGIRNKHSFPPST